MTGMSDYYIVYLSQRISAGEKIIGASESDIDEARAYLERLQVSAPVGAVGK